MIAKRILHLAKILVSDENELDGFSKKHYVYDLDKKVIKDMDKSDAVGAEYGNPHTYSLNELYEQYKSDSSIPYSYDSFDGWIDDITGKNGTCQWIGQIEDELYSIDGIDGYTLDEATQIAIEKNNKNEDIEILGTNLEEWKLCTWCEDLYPEGDMRKEMDMGYLCENCIDALKSRGERLRFEE